MGKRLALTAVVIAVIAGGAITYVEATVLSVAGGAIGIVVGATASHLVGRVMESSATVTASAVVLAFTFAVSVGVFFGFYPARKAARLSPIEALRYE
jgi:putative ABC transport system permease protein